MKKPNILLILFPLILIFLELTLRLVSGIAIDTISLISIFSISISLGLLLYCININYVTALIYTELCVIWFLIAYFSNNTYFVFMSPSIIANAATGVVSEFTGQLILVIKNGVLYILLFHIPVLILILCRKMICFNVKMLSLSRFLAVLVSVILLTGTYCIGMRVPNVKVKISSQYVYDNAVKTFGLGPALTIDIYNNAILKTADGNEMVSFSADTSDDIEEKTANDDYNSEQIYGCNVMDLDFDELAADENRSDNDKLIDEYISTLTPSRQNEYTGIFEGKNLILICAESFSKELIDEVRTPTLYRMETTGIVMEDYYQPFWGGSTTTGEYSFLVGQIPTDANSMAYTRGHNMYLTMGNQLKRLGYTSYAFHNGDMYYYSRNQTHENLGYDRFIAFGNGMEQGVVDQYPQSDLEMIDYTVPKFIDSEPFSVYYMTISGHCNYTYTSNCMSAKNKDYIESLGYDVSESIRAYYSCNQELEYALESLFTQLEDKGILNDTVIVLTSDHYPYGLKKSGAWENSTDHLEELYGFEGNSNPDRDHNAALIWCGSLEESEPIVVSEPTYSLDLLPTLSNLFGLEYDSRFLVGRDVFSDTEPLVIWIDGSWMTDAGYYDSSTGVFASNDGEVVPEEYINNINNKVNNKMIYSNYVLKNDYFGTLFTGEK